MNIKKVTQIFCFSAVLSSCQLAGSIDDIKPHYKLETDNVIRDAESADNALRGIYESWRQWGVSTPRPLMSILTGGLIRTGGIAGEAGFINNDLLPTNIALADIYRDYYRIINTANNFIALMEQGKAANMPESRVKACIAEAKIQRALAHFYLLRCFGYSFDVNSNYGIVLRSKPFEGLEVAKRNSVQESYQFILDDLAYGIQFAPETNKLHYYVSAQTAKALKAKVLLYMNNFGEAEKIAKEVLESSEKQGYILEANFGDIFLKGYRSSETLFSTYNFGSTENAQVSMERTTFSEYSRNVADLLVDNLANGNTSTGAGLDGRFGYMYSAATRGPLMNGKYPYGANAVTQRNAHILLRLGEVYLIHAEAAARNKNYGAARASLQTIASRAGYKSDYASLISNERLVNVIFEHKWLELLSENSEDWFDYVRYYKLKDIAINSIKNTITQDKQLILPMPTTALAGNNLLEQNP